MSRPSQMCIRDRARPGPQKNIQQGRPGLRSCGGHHRQHHHLLPVRQGGLLPDLPPSGQSRHQCGRVQVSLRLSVRAEAHVPEFRSQDAAQCPKGPAGPQGKAPGRKRLAGTRMALRPCTARAPAPRLYIRKGMLHGHPLPACSATPAPAGNRPLRRIPATGREIRAGTRAG